MIFEHTADINAPTSTVWALTIDIENWPSLMPTVTSVERLDVGSLQVGSAARLKQPGQRPTVWTVTNIEPENHFAWTAKLVGVSTLAYHRIESTPSGCRNTLGLELTGRGSRLLGALVGRRMRKVLEVENDSFRKASEARQ